MQPSREEEIHCPSCRRYVSTLERCPYCGARVPKRTVFRLLKWGGLALAVCGVLAIYADATMFKAVIKDPPPITLAEIKPTMNFAVVKVEGLVTGVFYSDPTRTLIITLSQGEQSISVLAFRGEAERLIETRNIPAVGDNYSAIGQLRVRPDSRMMILQVAGGLRFLDRPEAENMSISEVRRNVDNLLYRRVRVEGRYIKLPRFPYNIIEDEITEENLVIYTPRIPGVKRFDELGITTGQRLRVTGAVDVYRDLIELLPADVDKDIQVI